MERKTGQALYFVHGRMIFTSHRRIAFNLAEVTFTRYVFRGEKDSETWDANFMRMIFVSQQRSVQPFEIVISVPLKCINVQRVRRSQQLLAVNHPIVEVPFLH